MAAKYKLTYRHPNGQMGKENVPFSTLNFVRKENEVGKLNVMLLPVYPAGYFRRDGQFELHRSINGGPYTLEGETSFLLERLMMRRTANGENQLESEAFDMLTLPRRRMVDYEAGTVYTDKLGYADDEMKAIMRENFGALAIDTTRDLSAYLSVDVNQSKGAIVGDEISYKNIFDVLSNFAAASDEAGTRILFDIVKSGSGFIFKTWPNYRGVDHSETSAQPVLISQEMGNLSEPEIVVDWTEEVNYVLAAGKGEDNYQPTAAELDTARIGASPYARCESFVNASNVVDPVQLASVAKAALAKGRPRIQFNGRVLDTGKLKYGVHYKYGDLVTATYQGMSFDCRVDAVSIQLSNQGEALDIRLKGEAYA